MPLEILALDHVQITIPPSLESAALHFYGQALGLPRIPKPPTSRPDGAWYALPGAQLHVGIEDCDPANHHHSKRHLCLRVADLAAAEATLRAQAVPLLPDAQPTPGWRRFYLRDPAGNRIEIAQAIP